ncbi:response regulator receiver domain-containing protein [Thermosporothrix hazakensis]|jgi:DNA-binding response OmpR family regulator|uniref:Response regulator receiver domain-containing protein n=2 Tax=Thermosporothrix TaxID=768650 RepID=A0A326U0Q7_THEHA|nr:response regulator [Thermosporothrix hazakensis]PZW23000.1 response regulator receiver domain-containing protein [Thermosporothrix hazakensis]BBH90091.1 hypothetical protein KTC_48420 [Thermosporothrix sp. COM3]GCE48312.1 hypothetical protein KTH_31810 [Thermosporothrix hazakensis]
MVQAYQQQESPAAPSQKTILVVEDDRNIGLMLVEVLSQETPYQTLLVTDGKQALNAFARVKPDLFITDYLLPEMNGLELYDCLQARAELKCPPTILMSSQMPPLEEVKKRDLVPLTKPFDLDDFLNTVEALIQ